MIEYLSLIGVVLIVWGLYSRRIIASLIAMATGTIMISIALSETAGWTPAILVATLFAGGLIALMIAWMMLVTREEVRVDVTYALAVSLMLLTLLSIYILVGTGKIKFEVSQVTRIADINDYSLLTILLVTVLIGGLHIVKGEGG
ncbi:hypothetical protein MA03_04370 [Infirmifilum uzonense]|jgi:hypothetical protein|uniref:Uncharacterized protein n=1 Tax=Infirmifilum uzonense TaxID=1550241 RepID=A0A0F7FH98_9CREN|nr:hypothetical protein [Infirmifilum uzonense]AKG38668.1 hypothetical protein MA03_04370 [Infirmifilum uzonense]